MDGHNIENPDGDIDFLKLVAKIDIRRESAASIARLGQL